MKENAVVRVSLYVDKIDTELPFEFIFTDMVFNLANPTHATLDIIGVFAHTIGLKVEQTIKAQISEGVTHEYTNHA